MSLLDLDGAFQDSLSCTLSKSLADGHIVVVCIGIVDVVIVSPTEFITHRTLTETLATPLPCAAYLWAIGWIENSASPTTRFPCRRSLTSECVADLLAHRYDVTQIRRDVAIKQHVT